MFSTEKFLREYETDTVNVKVGDRSFVFFVPKSIDRFIDAGDVFQGFPLWAKVWEASMVLADHLARRKTHNEKRILEIGAGLGVVGIIASSFGHDVTMTEYNEDAMNFARANAEKNLISGYSRLKVVKLDWNNPDLKGVFDYIIGSEVVYNERDYQPLLRLFRNYLRPDGEIILCEGIRKTSVDFFRQMGSFFEIRASRKVLRSHDKETHFILGRMIFKPTDIT